MRMKALNPEVYMTDDATVAIGTDEIAFLEQTAKQSPRKVARFCAHRDSEETLHEMLIVHTGSAYVRPTKHPGNDESLHILKGAAQLVLFSEEGGVTDALPLGDQESGKAFYVRVPANTFHALVVQSENVVFHECINGPFRQGTRVFASWSPQVEAVGEVREFTTRISEAVERVLEPKPSLLLKMKRVSNEVYYSDEPVARMGKAEIDFLKRALPAAARKRVRICAHKNAEEPLQEMFIAFAKGTQLRPNKHLGKDNSVNVLEGRVDVAFFDDSGEISEVASLGDKSSGLPFYLRTPHDRWHGWIIRSDVLVVHETTDGPFRVENSLSAPWVPKPDDTNAVMTYQQKLEAEATRFVRESERRQGSARA